MDCQEKALERENTEAKLLEEEVDIKYPRGKIALYNVSKQSSPIQSDVSNIRSPVEKKPSLQYSDSKNRSPVQSDTYTCRSPTQSDVFIHRSPTESEVSNNKSPIQQDLLENCSKSENQDHECHVRILEDEFLEAEQVGKESEGRRKMLALLAFLHLYFYNQLCVLAAWVWNNVALPFWNWNKTVLCPFCYVTCLCLGLCIRLCTLGDS